jgi:hypothetical protein
MSDEKQVNAIRVFCARPAKETGKTRTVVRFHQEWTYLVNQIHYFDHGKALQEKDASILKDVAKSAAKRFPNDSSWEKTVSAPGAHEEILAIIREGLQTQLNRPQVAAPAASSS